MVDKTHDALIKGIAEDCVCEIIGTLPNGYRLQSTSDNGTHTNKLMK